MRTDIVLVGLVLIVAGFLASPLGFVSWVPFIVGFVMTGAGLMVDSRAKAAAKSKAARSRSRRGY